MASEPHSPVLSGALPPASATAPLRWLSRRLVRTLFANLKRGRLTLVTPGGDRFSSVQTEPGPDATMVLHRWRTLRRLVFGGDVAIAEAYIQGDWSSPDVSAIVELVAVNDEALRQTVSGFHLPRFVNRLRHASRRNSKRGSRRNIVAHYDLGNAFYARWLDAGMSYSSALYAAPDLGLEAAQTAKQDRIIEALALRGGERVLEIGCGWGGLAERLAQAGCYVTGITLSPAQLAYGRARIAAAGLQDRVELRLEDYRDVAGEFDRIVSVEMIEAVGRDYWPAYFATLRNRLTAGGAAVLQAITIADERYAFYARTPDFIQRYIFPGGMLPSLEIMARESHGAGLALAPVQSFGQSYALTLAEWRRRFQSAWHDIAASGFDETFRRMWDYYLAYCEGGFRSGATDVALYRLVHARA